MTKVTGRIVQEYEDEFGKIVRVTLLKERSTSALHNEPRLIYDSRTNRQIMMDDCLDIETSGDWTGL